MRARHGHEVDWVSILSQCSLAVTLIVAEAVFHADNDPIVAVSVAHPLKTARDRTKDW